MNARKLIGCSGLFAAFAMAVSGCATAPDEPLVADNQVDLTWEEFMGMIYQEPDSKIYIVNGDEPIVGERALHEFYNSLVGNGELIVHQNSGVDAKWTDSEKTNISYCVSSSSFGGNYNTVVTAMAQATGDWEAAAGGSINFVHNSSQDSNCTATNNNVVFDVRQVNTNQYLARAFFPHSGSRSSQNVLIATSALPNGSGPWSLRGILRHELGHVLGFRHEHTRPEAGTCFEDNNWRALTSYDSSSVMHYPQCNGTQTGDLVITSKDTQGIQALYGGGGGGPVCGNGACESGEDSSNCPADCGGGGGQSCVGFCGGQSADGCWCDSSCQSFGDCCPDYDPVCTGGGGGGCNGQDDGDVMSGTGDVNNHPTDGSSYQGFKYKYYSGGVSASLEGPSGTDFDLRLYRWNGSSFALHDSSLSSSSSESVSGTSTGYYAIRVDSYSGSGAYDLCID